MASSLLDDGTLAYNTTFSTGTISIQLHEAATALEAGHLAFGPGGALTISHSSNASLNSQSTIVQNVQASALVHPGVEIDDDIDGCDQNFGRDQHNDNPLQNLTVPPTSLLPQYC